MAVSFVELAIHPGRPRFRTVPTPPEYAAVEHTTPGILAEYPLGYSDVYRLWQTHHGRRLLDAAPVGSTNDDARLVLLDPAEPGTARSLAFLGVTAVAIHPGAHVDAEVPPREPPAGSGYSLVGRFPGGTTLWQVIASPAPALVTLPGGFATPRRAGAEIAYPLVSPSGVGVLEIRAKRAGVIELVFGATPPAGARRTLRVADPQREQSFVLAGTTRVSVNVAVPRGVSQLLVKTDPPPSSEADAIMLSTPRAERSTGNATLQAQLLSADPGF
jgi:hypothetical protein